MPPESPRDVRLASLAKFYADPGNLKTLTDVLKDRTGISLRALDWLVTNYCKKRNIVYMSNGQCFNMWTNYKAQLRGFSKSMFDPFKRLNKKKKKVGDDDDNDDDEILEWVDADGDVISTTVGQLNFFKWAIENGVLQYCIDNVDLIEKDMHQSTKHRYDPRAKKGRRSELSKVSVINTCAHTKINVKLVF